MGGSHSTSSHLVDPDTPWSFRTTFSLHDRRAYTLVMSDEFEAPGRDFGELSGDRRWTAVRHLDPTNGNVAYMSPDMVTTRNGALEITTTNTGGLGQSAKYSSGSVQSWNKFCFQGGAVEVSFSLPGLPGLPGVWPAIWMLGNLGRATYPQSSKGLWPFSYETCDDRRGGDISGSAQRISACDGKNRSEEGLLAGQGRGVPEIDLLEVISHFALCFPCLPHMSHAHVSPHVTCHTPTPPPTCRTPILPMCSHT